MKTLAAACLVLAALTGCAVGPNYKQPPVTAPDAYREVQGPPTPAASLADQPWWEAFGDPVLIKLIDEALQKRGKYGIGRLCVARPQELVGQL